MPIDPTPTTDSAPAPFGSVFADQMVVAHYAHGVWEAPKLGPVEPLVLHPAAHALHYGSACFEGLKAHRGVDGIVRIFRLEDHVRRMLRSAATLVLPVPSESTLTEMIVESVRANLEHVPEAPGSLYVRPTLLGTEANIGAAARATAEALLYVLTSPVGDYFEGGVRALKLAIETDRPRTTPQFGAVKSGANYAMALSATVDAQRAFDVDQVLFAPGGIVQETGASNFLLLDAERVVTPALSAAFLEGVTRASVLQIAGDLGYEVEERVVTVDEVLAWARRDDAEAALSGTAAVMAGVGEIVSDGARITVGSGDVGPHTMAIRLALTEVHTAERPDTHGWLTPVTR